MLKVSGARLQLPKLAKALENMKNERKRQARHYNGGSLAITFTMDELVFVDFHHMRLSQMGKQLNKFVIHWESHWFSGQRVA